MTQKSKDPLFDALKDGRPFTLQVPYGGDLASMREALVHGQTLTLRPPESLDEVLVGDIVYVQWRNSSRLLHIVGEKKDNRFLITNSSGGRNGWVEFEAVLGRVICSHRSEIPTAVEDLLELYRNRLDRMSGSRTASVGELHQLTAIYNAFVYYADTLGTERWKLQPKPNAWSFQSHLRYFLSYLMQYTDVTRPLDALIDIGFARLGLIAEGVLHTRQPEIRDANSWA